VIILGFCLAIWPRRAVQPVEARAKVPQGAQPAS